MLKVAIFITVEKKLLQKEAHNVGWDGGICTTVFLPLAAGSHPGLEQSLNKSQVLLPGATPCQFWLTGSWPDLEHHGFPVHLSIQITETSKHGFK